MIRILSKASLILMVFTALLTTTVNAQQDPQYTQYMYNTMSVNPAYAGQREALSIVGLYRNQWVGINGAPETMTLGVHSPLNNERIGLGLSVLNDRLGPADETYVNGNFSYTILMDYFNETKLSFGVSAGFHQLRTDWSKGQFKQPDVVFNENINRFAPTVGAGVYLHSNQWYLGLSVPNFITTQHYNDFQESLASERMHFFIIGGYVFNLSERTKFKQAFLVKAVSGAPLIADVSGNFFFNDKFTLGAAWRWGDSVSALAGFQLSEKMFIGYAYDLTRTNLNNYNSGTHEVILRFELPQIGKLISPRCF